MLNLGFSLGLGLWLGQDPTRVSFLRGSHSAVVSVGIREIEGRRKDSLGLSICETVRRKLRA